MAHCLRLFHPCHAVAFKRLDRLGVVVLHAGEGDNSIAWRLNHFVEYPEPVRFTKAEFLQFILDQSL